MLCSGAVALTYGHGVDRRPLQRRPLQRQGSPWAPVVSSTGVSYQPYVAGLPTGADLFGDEAVEENVASAVEDVP